MMLFKMQVWSKESHGELHYGLSLKTVKMHLGYYLRGDMLELKWYVLLKHKRMRYESDSLTINITPDTPANHTKSLAEQEAEGD